MNIRQLVERLEQIEARCKGEAQELCYELINDLIEEDLKLEKTFKKFNRKLEDDFIEYLMTEGIKSGSIGEA